VGRDGALHRSRCGALNGLKHERIGLVITAQDAERKESPATAESSEGELAK